MIREENTIVRVERHWQFGGGGVWSGESRGLEGGVGVKRVVRGGKEEEEEEERKIEEK